MTKLKTSKTVTQKLKGDKQENIMKAITGVGTMQKEIEAKTQVGMAGGAEEVDTLLKGQPSEADEQEIIEVSQDEVKKALKVLITKKNDMISLLYAKHEEYNAQYFDNGLSMPLLTIEKMNNRTLANYTFGNNNIPIENHIRFNSNFIALNTEVRILETLRHEMIHQWQDQIIYAKTGVETFEAFKKATIGADGEIEYVDAVQKKRPKEWHNADFKELAAVVGIPATGSKCHGNPAKMPEPKSYNRKFVCGCIASNNYPVTIWSTREVFARCTVCENEFKEVKKVNKKAITIEVDKSHVEKDNQDGVHDNMKAKFTYFERFDNKGKKDAFIANLKDDEHPATELESGVYQKGHNAYHWGYRYWVAFNTSEVNPDAVYKVEDDTEVKPDPKPAPQKPKAKTKAKKPKVAPKPKDKKGAEDVVEKTYNLDKPEDLIAAYKEKGSTRAAAELFNVNQSTFIRRAQKYKINFKTGEFAPQ
jgi:predicted SprT family Zn-dependent metalloprotease